MARSKELTHFMDELAGRGEPFVLAIVVSIQGSSLGKPGFKAVVGRDGRILYGTLGGVCPESVVSAISLEAIRTGKARVVKVHLEDARNALEGTLTNKNPDEVYVETNCGGVMDIYVDPYLPADRLVLIGQGGKDDVEDGLVRLGKMMGYETVVIDHLPVLSDEPDQLITDLDYDLTRFSFLPTDSVVVLTKGERDVGTLEVLSRAGARFVGLMASMQRARDTLAALKAKGAPEQFLQSVHTPIGLDIGAVSPEEICVAIMGDVTATKRGRHVAHGALASQAPPRVAT